MNTDAVNFVPVVADQFWTAFHAVDRLNSWVRSGGATHPIDSTPQRRLRETIYWVKTKAIIEASRREQAQFRRVRVDKQCRTCGGTGRFYPWYSHYEEDVFEPCRNCKSTGTATLCFIETRIHGVIWHTPQHKWYFSSLDVYVPFASFYPDIGAYEFLAPGEWDVLQPGQPMPPADVRRDFWLMYRQFAREVDFIVGFHHFAPRGIKSSNQVREWFEEQLAAGSIRRKEATANA